MPRFSVNQVTTKQWSLEEDAFNYSATRYAATQCQGIGLWRDKVSDYGDEKARDLLNEFSLIPSSYSYVGGFTGCQGRWTECVRDAEEQLEIARCLGAKNVLLFSGSLNGHIRPQALRCLLDAIDQLLPRAEKLGIRLLLQPMLESVSRAWNFLFDWDSVFSILDRYGSHQLGFVLNTYHSTFLNEVWSELPNRMDQLGLVQISDGLRFPRSGQAREDCFLGDGLLLPDVRLDEILSAGYGGWIEVESVGKTITEAGYGATLEANGQFLHAYQKHSRQRVASRSIS